MVFYHVSNVCNILFFVFFFLFFFFKEIVLYLIVIYIYIYIYGSLIKKKKKSIYWTEGVLGQRC